MQALHPPTTAEFWHVQDIDQQHPVHENTSRTAAYSMPLSLAIVDDCALSPSWSLRRHEMPIVSLVASALLRQPSWFLQHVFASDRLRLRAQSSGREARMFHQYSGQMDV